MIVRDALDNGIRLVTESMSHVRSVSLGVWLARGSRHETDGESGIAHFVAADNRLLAPVAPFKFATENTPADRRQRWDLALQDLR